MSKVASYLQEHIEGEASIQPDTLQTFSTDSSVLAIEPETVIYPRTTNDVRKIARFAWQIAEKGHTVAITPRGNGNDTTGAAIGAGIVLDFTAHMNRLFEYEPKQKLVRLQPGLSATQLLHTLATHDATVPALVSLPRYGTIGGAIANNLGGAQSHLYGATDAWTYQLEVVLANGEVLQTGRLNKKELAKKKGLQTFEGEIYRNLDNLIEDNSQLIKDEIDERLGNVGYASIAKVKQQNGSFDLTPLFLGSQGTLGIISEAIIKTDTAANGLSVTLAAFSDASSLLEAIDYCRSLDPSEMHFYDSQLLDEAARRGRKYTACDTALGTDGGVLLVKFAGTSERARRHKTKKLQKYLQKSGAEHATASGDDAFALIAVQDSTWFVGNPTGSGESTPPIVDGAYIPADKLASFLTARTALADKYHCKSLPLYGDVLCGLYTVRPLFQLRNVSDKQKVLKFVAEYAQIIRQHGGRLVGYGAEGRLKAQASYQAIDDDVVQLFMSIKSIMDPYTLLNPGVKQMVELKEIAGMLRSDYTSVVSTRYISQ
jgi:FAD/FMN-containing dehydrogenase